LLLHPPLGLRRSGPPSPTHWGEGGVGDSDCFARSELAGSGWGPTGRRFCYTRAMSSDDAPKSAYELAMERLRKKDQEAGGGDDRPLTDAQRAAIAEARQVHKAKGAELEILHQAALRKAKTPEEIAELNEKLRRDQDRLASERDCKIEAIRKSASP